MIALVVTLILVGLLLWLVETLLPIDATIKRVIHVVVVVMVVLWLLQMFGILGLDVPVPRLR